MIAVRTSMLSAAEADGETDADVRVKAVSKTFGGFAAVKNVSLEVPKGSFFSLLGPSGSGKTTLLRLISGFEFPDSGRIEIAGRDVTRTPPNARPTAMVFQRWALFPHMTAEENIAFGLRVRRKSRRECAAVASTMLELVGLGGLNDRKPGQMSGGQQQRVALARALAIQPNVLLLDEPLASLDLKLRVQMQLELKRIQREVGTTFVFVTHDQGEAMTMSDQIAVVNHGLIEQLGSPAEIYDHPTTPFVAGFIGDVNLIRVLGDGPRSLRAGGLRIAAEPTLPITAGESYAFSIRCERVQIGKNLPGPNRFTGGIREVVFAGRCVRYTVALERSDLELTVEVPHDGAQLHQPGDTVEVGWHPSAGRVLPE